MKTTVKSALIATASLFSLSTTAIAQDSDIPAPATEVANQAEQKAATQKKDGPQLGTYGFDADGMDTSTKPGDNFFRYANGTWLDKTEIPADKSNYGMFTVLADLSNDRVREVLEKERNIETSKSGAVYESYLDEARVEELGMEPVAPWLNRIRAVQNKIGLQQLIPVAARNGVGSIFGGYVGQDDKDPESYIFNIYQSGTGLPDRDMYLVDNEKFAEIRTAYKAYLAQMLDLAGETNSEARANAIFDFEKLVAEAQWTREDRSDSTKTYNKMTVAELDEMAWGLDMTSIMKAISPKIDNVIVGQPSAIKAAAKLFAQADLEMLKDQMIVNSLRSFANVLPNKIADTNFAFYGTKLSGTPEREERWKRAVSFTESVVGEDVGKSYAAEYFPAETKAAMNELVDNVLGAMGSRIDGL